MKEFLVWATAFVLLMSGVIFWMKSVTPTEQDIQNVIKKYDCKPTNEFVGKYADRLYLCHDGLKYKETAFYSWAYAEKNK